MVMMGWKDREAWDQSKVPFLKSKHSRSAQVLNRSSSPVGSVHEEEKRVLNRPNAQFFSQKESESMNEQ